MIADLAVTKTRTAGDVYGRLLFVVRHYYVAILISTRYARVKADANLKNICFLMVNDILSHYTNGEENTTQLPRTQKRAKKKNADSCDDSSTDSTPKKKRTMFQAAKRKKPSKKGGI